MNATQKAKILKDVRRWAPNRAGSYEEWERQEGVELVITHGWSVGAVAGLYGCHQNTVRGWIYTRKVAVDLDTRHTKRDLKKPGAEDPRIALRKGRGRPVKELKGVPNLDKKVRVA